MRRWFAVGSLVLAGLGGGCRLEPVLPLDPPFCGDGIVLNAGEECDLGNANADNAGCTSRCQLARCGDGLFYDGVEECDLGAANDDTGACTSNCLLPRCGDGFVQAGEECDLGNANADTSACTRACKLARCGDSLVQEGVEECDNGANNGAQARCTPDCTEARCGDGYLRQPAEECDDGNPFGADGCGPQCTTPRVLRPANAANSIDGVHPDTLTGREMFVLGDVNGDGNDDIGFKGKQALDRVAHVVYDVLTDTSVGQADVTVDDDSSTILNIFPIGDIDGDQLADFAITTNYRNEFREFYIHIFVGSPTGTLTLDDAYAVLLMTASVQGGDAAIFVTPAGDIDGNGIDEFLVLSRNSRPAGGGVGTLNIVSAVAPGFQQLNQASRTVFVPGTPDVALVDAGPIGDTNADGMLDLFVRTTTRSGGSAVVGLSGDAVGVNALDSPLFVLEQPDRSIVAARGGGDFSGDGQPDLFVIEQREGFGPEFSAVHGFEGPLAGTLSFGSSDFSITGEFAGPAYVAGLGGVGDLDGNGIDDLVFYSRLDGFDTTSDGNVYALLGPVSGPTQASFSDLIVRWGSGSVPIYNFFNSSLGDFDGDDVADLVIADPFHSDARGQISVILGRDLFD